MELKNLQTFSEFINESEKSKINEQITVTEYIEYSEGDDEWIKIAQNCVKFLKINGNSIYWITSDDEDEKWDDIENFWNDKANYQNVTKFIAGSNEGPDGRGSAFYGDTKIPMIKYEASGINTYVIPVSVYKKL
jgi:hypothetical protein